MAVLVAATVIPLLGCGAGGPPPGEAQPPVPSVILIVIDTLRADFLGTYGFDGPTSPELDTLAAESIVFERCSAQAPWTTPSMASLMTSLYPEAHGVRLGPDDPRTLDGWRKRWTRAIPDSTTTLAEVLEDRGYRTAAFVANPWLVKGLGFEQGFDTFDESAVERNDRNATMLLHSGLLWLRSKATTASPTFLYLHLMDVHGPYQSPESDFNIVRESAGLGPDRTLPPTGLRNIEKYLLRPQWAKHPNRHKLRIWRGRYAAGVHAVDRRLGAFFQALEDEGLWEEQTVIVTADHGEELFDHGGWDHGFNLYEHQLHVPLMIRLPKARFGGTRITEPVRLVDLMPTIARLCGAGEPQGIVGLNLLSLTTGATDEAPPRPVFATSAKHRRGTTAISDGRYKLISDLDAQRIRLFDLATDPEELIDLAPEHPGIVARLSSQLGREIARVESGDSTTGQVGGIPEEQLDRLRELGYLE